MYIGYCFLFGVKITIRLSVSDNAVVKFKVHEKKPIM